MRKFRVTTTPETTTMTTKEDGPYDAYIRMVGTLQGYTDLESISYEGPYLWRGEAINPDPDKGMVIWVKELV